jgi:hypothetical protein
LNNDQINQLLEALPVESYRHAVNPQPVTLGPDMAAALGVTGIDKTAQRKLMRVLAAVIDAITDKLYIEKIATNDALTDGAIDAILTHNKWETLQRKIYRAVVRDGSAYILTSVTNTTPTFTLREAFDGRCGAAYIYDSRDKDRVLFGINTWYVGDWRYLDVYFTDKIEKYINKDGKTWEQRQDSVNEAWPVDWTDNTNAPLGLALIKFDIGDSDIEDAIQTQRDINDALLDLMATSRTMGFPQRYVTSVSNPEYLLDAYGNPLIDVFGRAIRRNLTTSPGSIFVLQGKDAQFGQLDAASLDTSLIDKLLHLLSVQTTVPVFYFTGGDFPSGVALIQAESRLNSKVESHQAELDSSVQQLIRLSLRLSNTFANTKYNADLTIFIDWYPPQVETDDLRMEAERTTVQVVTLAVGAGVMSIEQAVRRLNPTWDDAQVAQELNRINAEKQSITL